MTIPSVSVMTMVFGGPLTEGSLTDVAMLEALEHMGFDGVEIPSGRLVDQPERLRAYSAYLGSSRLKATCVDGGCNFVAPDQSTRAKGVAALHAAIEVALTLKCSLVLAAGSRLSGDITPAAGRRMIIDGLQACSATANEIGITLAIENFGVAPTLQCAAAHCLEILNAVPGLAFVFDTGNFYFCHEDPLKNMDALMSRTRHVHLKDWVKSDAPEIADVSGTALGTGLIPNEEIIGKFRSVNPAVSFSLEVGAPGDKVKAVQQDLQTVRRWLKSA